MRRININPNLIIPLVFVFVFLPILSFTFGLKNDILTGYLPVKFFMSESLSAGYIPWWNPYVNFGLPQHADMSSGFWNPITWIISLSVGYNIYSITIELLFYILAGSIGMFKLGKLWNWGVPTQLIAAISYMGCGYFIGHIQHLNWVSGAGFLPWCFFAYKLLLKKQTIYNLSVAVICFYMFVSSSHPGLIIGAIYFFSIITISEFISASKQDGYRLTAKRILFPTLLMLVFILVLSAGMVISYAQILPYITREVKPVINDIHLNSTSMSSLMSFIWPAAITRNANFFLSDISLRNSYMGIIPFLLLLSSYKSFYKNKQLWGFLISSLFFLILSVPSPIQDFFYRIVPLLGYVRLPGEFRIFTLFGFILIACTWLDHVLKNKDTEKTIQVSASILLFTIMLAATYSLYQIFVLKNSFLFANSLSKEPGNLRITLKLFANNITLYDLILLQSFVQIVLIQLFKKTILTRKHTIILLICIVDIFIASSINLPFTGYGRKSAKELQEFLNASPKGITTPPLLPIRNHQKGAAGIDSILGDWSFYNKQPGNIKQANYPIQFKSESIIYEEKSIANLQEKPFLFFEPDTLQQSQTNAAQTLKHTILPHELRLLTYSPGALKASLQNTTAGTFTVMYKYYPHWVCTVNGNEYQLVKTNSPFLQARIKNHGSQLIEFKYSPRLLIQVSLFCLFLFAALLIIVIANQIK